jgi:hypothetical protein
MKCTFERRDTGNLLGRPKVRNAATVFSGDPMTQDSMIGRLSLRKARGRRACAAALSVLLAGGILVARVWPVAADTGDKIGWSAITDPRKRVFLIYVPSAGAPRALNFACLRDVDDLTVYSEGVAGNLPSGPATLTMSNGDARYDVAGNIAPDLISKLPTFTGELADDKRTLSGISAKLLPILQGSGPIIYEISAGTAPDGILKSPSSIPVRGLAAPLAKFKSICFGP